MTLEAELRGHYGFADVAIGERLEGGYANDMLRVVADGEGYVLRVKRPPLLREDIEWDHRLLALLADRLEEVHAPVVTADGATAFPWRDRAAWLTPFVAGTPADPDVEPHRTQAAAALGRLHRAGAELGLAPRPRLEALAHLTWPPLRDPEQLRPWRDEIAERRAWAIDYVARLAAERSLCTSLVHGDYFPGNVLVAGGRVAAIVDWEEARHDWLTWDLAAAVWTFCRVDDDLDRDACAGFLAAYRHAGGTAPPEDDDLLLPLIHVELIREVLRAPTDRDPRWDHQRSNLRSLAKLDADVR